MIDKRFKYRDFVKQVLILSDLQHCTLQDWFAMLNFPYGKIEFYRQGLLHSSGGKENIRALLQTPVVSPKSKYVLCISQALGPLEALIHPLPRNAVIADAYATPLLHSMSLESNSMSSIEEVTRITSLETNLW
ncbi:hypothetical protein TNCV_3309151 [Trichonephila clavipes]|nr:hypothetical protein TNCV_3309151 [Trichonephila clavipes]